MPESGTDSHLPSVSVIVPARNAQATIAATLDSIFSQDYTGPMDVTVADGSDTPATANLIRERYPLVRLVPNLQHTTGYGANAAIQASTGEIVVRCDAHTAFPPGYVRRAVATITRTGAANVGGRQCPVGSTWFERAVAVAMTMSLGSGGARYRIGGTEGPADTVFLGVFRREVLEAVGGYDSTLIRNQDYELNWRLRQRGETVWFDPHLCASYRPRSSFWKLARQYFDYGRWKRVVLRRHPASRRVRHLVVSLLVPVLAVSGLLAFVGVPWVVSAAPPLAYLLVLLAGAFIAGIRRRESAALILPLVLVTMHLSWGIGFFMPPPGRGE